MTDAAEKSPIDRVFKRLAATYGTAWDKSLGRAPLADVKTVWLHEMAGFLQSRPAMMAIAWALENLPERCPNAIEFRNLCRAAPAAEVPALPEPRPDPQRVQSELARLAPLRAKLAAAPPTGNKDWARILLTRHESKEYIATPTALQMAHQALGHVAQVAA